MYLFPHCLKSLKITLYGAFVTDLLAQQIFDGICRIFFLFLTSFMNDNLYFMLFFSVFYLFGGSIICLYFCLVFT